MAPQLYFITGLPRSRTAWFSQFLTTGPSICLHEPTARCGSMKELRELMESQQPTGYVGASDPNIGVYAEDWIEEFPTARIVAVGRPRDECLWSLMRAFPGKLRNAQQVIEKTEAGLTQIEDFLGGLPTARFHQLDEDIRDLWEATGISRPFPEERYEAMRNLRIAVIPKPPTALNPAALAWYQRRLES